MFGIPTYALLVKRLRVIGGQRLCRPREDGRREQPIYERPVNQVASSKKVFSKRRVNELVWE